ncbi:hypothetical protein XNC1_3511 [Xenorhabdus nematophila ATCC 19061]|uniref:Uncharacterized protein n=1 Tax=Xenorhabdus nematophila (strain ATCC 19061 / DSM 3370 / CCUG 14189 / LMG 1036 / NCIMB 9965 / AN6) TaxID=406817 RepID=D3V9K0_XENNA|nr:hypothetical protein [Xenorhabdus nematophila]CBJ91550.1 hypothetical protein XNC1_3511 [Xenorhabdus nematophila ATCC 19061]CEK24374.1 hypothetical protein XNC2_3380 [Xenorhabdus nematophila AN6/1]
MAPRGGIIGQADAGRAAAPVPVAADELKAAHRHRPAGGQEHCTRSVRWLCDRKIAWS